MLTVNQLGYEKLLLVVIFCTCVSAQKVSYVTLWGDTYVMNMIKGWELSTGEKLYKKPARRTVRGYEATQITRIRPKNSIRIWERLFL